MKLTKQQQQCVKVLETCRHAGPEYLATAIGTSKEGAAATASSLVRKGIAERIKVNGKVAYRLYATPTPATSKCKACRGQAHRHTCGLAELQNMLRF